MLSALLHYLLDTKNVRLICTFTKPLINRIRLINSLKAAGLSLFTNSVAETVQHDTEQCRLFKTLQINRQKEIILFRFIFKIIRLPLFNYY